MRRLTLALALLLVMLAPALRAQSPPPTTVFFEIPAIALPPTIPPTACSGTPTTVTCMNLDTPISYKSIMVDGYYSATDGAGGYFVKNGSGCTPGPMTNANGGSIIYDLSGHCFYRTSPPTDVHQWGARCDVQSFGAGGVWDATNGWIVIQTASLPGLTVGMADPTNPTFITVTQIGPGSGVVGGVATPTPFWADRWSKLGNPGGLLGNPGYRVGDLVAFQSYGTPDPSVLSQQVSIVVDQLGVGAANPSLRSGPIYKWHFVTGGQYTALPSLNPMDGSMKIDLTHSCLGPIMLGACATGGDMSASFIPAWSGWSVMDAGTTLRTAGFSGSVSLGQVITLDLPAGSGAIVNQSHYPKIVVTSVVGGGSSGALASWQWLDYGSYSMIPPTPADLVQTAACSTSCVHLIPEWTRGTLATTIAEVDQHGHGGSACPPSSPIPTFCIKPKDTPIGIQNGQPIEAFYYGHDDGQFINAALASSTNGQTIHVTGHCGTTQPIILPNNPGTVTPANTTLAGSSYKTAGIFAFAWDINDRGAMVGGLTLPTLMNHVVYGPAGKLAFGGGIRDLEIEGMGVPQGFGFYYNTTPGSVVTTPTGYNGPMVTSSSTWCITTKATLITPSRYVCTPSSGSVVEVDDAKEAFFTDLAVYDAYGEGNAEFQAGENDADPTTTLGSDFGSVFLNSDRFALNSNQQGALDPEFAIDFQSVHDSQYSNLVAFDATEAHIFEGKGNIYTGVHVASAAVSAQHGTGAPQPIAWTPPGMPVPPLAGAALYGLESPKNVTLSNMQCDVVWSACVFIGSSFPTPSDAPSVITNIAQKCSGLGNVWPTYYGVELATAINGAAVSNVDASPACGVANTQLVYFDNPADGAQMTSQNLAAQYCMPARGFQPGRYYTTPFTSAASAPLSPNTLYAIPVLIACQVDVTELSTSVVTGAGASCEYGIYGDNGAGQPGTLILDAGSVSLPASGPSHSLALSQRLSPGLVFLVVDCNGTPTLRGGSVTGNLMGALERDHLRMEHTQS
jgi:hypothetical protein